MRISTSQIYDSGVMGIQRNQTALFRLQNQISSETRIVTPADDPVAAAQVLVVSQSLAVEEQYQTNQKTATSQLSLVDGQLNSLTSSLQTIRDSIVKAGNGSLTTGDRQSIANDIEASLKDILGIANSSNGTGDYLFSGYQGATLPFAATGGTPVPPATTSPVAYFGDDGERLVQVSSSRQIATTVPGSDVFMSGKNGNGTFVVTTGGNVAVSATATNTGSASAAPVAVTDRLKWASAQTNTAVGRPLEIRFTDATHYGIYDPASSTTTGPLAYTAGAAIPLVTGSTPPVDFGASIVVTGTPNAGDSFSTNPNINQGTAIADAGSVTDTQKWSAAVNSTLAGRPVEIRFSSNVTTGKMEYSIYDPVGGATTAQSFTSGQAISLKTAGGVDFGSQVVVTGAPANGDTLTVTPSSSQSIFTTVQSLLGSLRSPVGSTTYSKTQLANDLAGALTNIDQATLQVSQVQSTVGTSERELEALASTSSDLVIQYKSTLSGLQDLDYAKALSDFTKQQVALEAAQKSFVQISGLSLFKYI